MKRNFLFLQGPLSFFFYRFGQKLKSLGFGVYRIQLCGGDVAFWPSSKAVSFTRSRLRWPNFIHSFFVKHAITDLVLLGDWRPLHEEAILLAQTLGITVWVYEEGYLRPGFVTLEKGGVNAKSHLPKTAEQVFERDQAIADETLNQASKAPNPIQGRVLSTIYHHIGNFFLWPYFFRYHTHRPYCIGRELIGLLPRYFSRKKRRKDSIESYRGLVRQVAPFYFMPLQLDSDSQIRIHSPFPGVIDAIAYVVTSFSKHAPKNSYLLVKNHPLDNGLIKYKRYLTSMAKACECEDRVLFIESVNNASILDHCQAVVLCNSTLGLTALQRGKSVYCLGSSLYAMPGLALCAKDMPLDDFWCNPVPPKKELVAAFVRVMQHDALIPGNFYTRQGIHELIAHSLVRMGVRDECS